MDGTSSGESSGRTASALRTSGSPELRGSRGLIFLGGFSPGSILPLHGVDSNSPRDRNRIVKPFRGRPHGGVNIIQAKKGRRKRLQRDGPY